MKDIKDFINEGFGPFKDHKMPWILMVHCDIIVEKLEIEFHGRTFDIKNKKDCDEYAKIWKDADTLPADKLHIVLNDSLELIHLDAEASECTKYGVSKVKINGDIGKANVTDTQQWYKIFKDIQDEYIKDASFITYWGIDKEIGKLG